MIDFINKIKRGFQRLQLYSRLFQINRKVAAHAGPEIQEKPIVFFNATARLKGLNLNAAFSMITSWGIQLAGRQVHHFSCQSGMSHCVLGAGLGDPQALPPCKECIKYSDWFTGSAPTNWFDYQEDIVLKNQLNNKSVSELKEINYKDRPLGRLVLPSVRWILRRHHLDNDEITRYLYGEFILSAHNIAEKFSTFIKEVDPETVVVFNGLQYPEAIVSWVAKQRDIRVITYEVNLLPFSAFFTEGQATEYSLNIPKSFILTEEQNRVLDQYLQQRFQGDFKMAGIKFWSAMDQLPADFLSFIEGFEGLVPVFTNVIFDTSQAHANTIFPHMFAWLDLVRETAEKNPKILFVIRAHPDEMRKGKSSQESVISWAADQKLENLPNIKLIGPDETLSSYELIQRSKFTMVYNSSIGLEATLLGAPVLCAGQARYTQYPTVFYPDSLLEYKELLTSFLVKDEIHVPDHMLVNGRRFLFYQLYRASLPFGEFLRDYPMSGKVQLKRFSWKRILPGGSPVVDCVVNGILNGDEFILETNLESGKLVA
ncbi:MAG: hypothetical protein MUO54_11555 [Anaerolineales bacterium]|nr:hypothetical protein [Anaerolineales bacterium]